MPVFLRKCLLGLLLILVNISHLSADSVKTALFMKKISRCIKQNMKRDETPGVVILISSPKVGILSEAYGFATLPPQAKKMTTDNLFRVASISKTYLSVMILKLVEAGKIGLQDPILKYLPSDLDLTLIPQVRKITIKHLLNMTSGIPEYYDIDVDEHLASFPYKKWRPIDAVIFSADLKPQFAPGRGYQYSNTNYALLQIILKKVTGKNLNQNLQTMIVKPLGLKDTFADDFKMSPYTLDTKGYDTKLDDIDVSHKDDGFGIGDTFVVTNAKDLNAFINALFIEKKLLSPSLLKKMLTANAYGRYGMGIEVGFSRRWGEIYSHNGLVNGFQTNYFFLPKHKLTVIILTNNRATTLIEPVFVRMLQYYRTLLKS